MPIDKDLLDILACPKCKADLRYDEEHDKLVCTNSECGLVYRIEDGIPILLIDEAVKSDGRGAE